jgi:hypothetical protein
MQRPTFSRQDFSPALTHEIRPIVSESTIIEISEAVQKRIRTSRLERPGVGNARDPLARLRSTRLSRALPRKKDPAPFAMIAFPTLHRWISLIEERLVTDEQPAAAGQDYY